MKTIAFLIIVTGAMSSVTSEASIRLSPRRELGVNLEASRAAPSPLPNRARFARKAAFVGGGVTAQVLALAGFLALIVGLLIHWSGDTSCHDQVSVFSPSPSPAPTRPSEP